jgi:hypothetical protein
MEDIIFYDYFIFYRTGKMENKEIAGSTYVRYLIYFLYSAGGRICMRRAIRKAIIKSNML